MLEVLHLWSKQPKSFPCQLQFCSTIMNHQELLVKIENQPFWVLSIHRSHEIQNQAAAVWQGSMPCISVGRSARVDCAVSPTCAPTGSSLPAPPKSPSADKANQYRVALHKVAVPGPPCYLPWTFPFATSKIYIHFLLFCVYRLW